MTRNCNGNSVGTVILELVYYLEIKVEFFYSGVNSMI